MIATGTVPFKRTRGGEQEQRAATLELFFDLVFVFAITQVSHVILDQGVTWEYAGQAALCLLVVWCAWNYTTWVTNELDPESTVVRLLMIGLMLVSLLMAIAIPQAFGDKALLLAGSYVAIQVGRHLFLTFAAAERGTVERERAGRILTWFVAAGILWLAGAIAKNEGRTALWLVALALNYGAPLVLFWLPGAHVSPARHGRWRPPTSPSARPVRDHRAWRDDRPHRSDHRRERARLRHGGRLWRRLPRHGRPLVAHFTSIARLAEKALAEAADRTLLARDAYTYGHVLIIAGIVLTAVGDELVIAHPTEELPTAELIAVVGGPIIYLLAQALLRLRMTSGISVRRLAGALACVVVGFVGTAATAVVLGALVVLVLVGEAIADTIAGARRAGPTATRTTP